MPAESPQPPHDPLAADFESLDRDGTGARQHVEKNGRMFEAVTGRPVVRVTAGELTAAVDMAETALIESGMKIFQRDSPLTLVRLRLRPEQTVRNYRRPPGILGMVTVEPPYLLEKLTQIARWERYDSRSDKWKRTNCPEQVVGTLLARGGEWRLPRISGAISTPTLRPDGSVLQKPGYDAAMRVFYDPCNVTFPEIPERPSKDDAAAAFEVLREAFGSFPYQTEVDEAVALALVLTATVRRSLPSAPLGAISAPKPGSGKSLLADCIGILALGTPPPAMTFAAKDEEAQKTALSVLMQGESVVLIDNVQRPLEGEWLCSILTQEIYSQRVLGKNEMVTVPTRTLWLATGNHLTVAGDMRTRALLCRIDSKLEHPEQRPFNYDLRIRMLADRPKIVAAALTLMRAYIATGQTAREVGVKPWGRFEQWSDMVRAPLVWMDCADPCESLKTIEADDPMRSELLQVMFLWERVFGDKRMTARQVVQHIAGTQATDDEAGLFALARDLWLDNRTATISSRRMGKWLERNRDAPVGMGTPEGRIQLQIERAGVHDNTVQWRVMKRKA